MDFNCIWQQSISEHDGESKMYPGSYAQGQGRVIGLTQFL